MEPLLHYHHLTYLSNSYAYRMGPVDAGDHPRLTDRSHRLAIVTFPFPTSVLWMVEWRILLHDESSPEIKCMM